MCRGPSERCRMEGDARNENGERVKNICDRRKGEKGRGKGGKERERVGAMGEKKIGEWESWKELDHQTPALCA